LTFEHSLCNLLLFYACRYVFMLQATATAAAAGAAAAANSGGSIKCSNSSSNSSRSSESTVRPVHVLLCMHTRAFTHTHIRTTINGIDGNARRMERECKCHAHFSAIPNRDKQCCEHRKLKSGLTERARWITAALRTC